MANNRHKNRRALIVRLDKIAEDSAWKDDGLEGMILAVDGFAKDPTSINTADCYSGEILKLPPTARPLHLGRISIRGSFTVLFSIAFTPKNRKEILDCYGVSW